MTEPAAVKVAERRKPSKDGNRRREASVPFSEWKRGRQRAHVQRLIDRLPNSGWYARCSESGCEARALSSAWTRAERSAAHIVDTRSRRWRLPPSDSAQRTGRVGRSAMAIFVVGEHAVNAAAEMALGACNRGGQWWIQPIETGHERRRPSKPMLSEVTLLLEMATRETGSIRSRRSSSPSGSWAKRIAGPGPRSGLIEPQSGNASSTSAY